MKKLLLGVLLLLAVLSLQAIAQTEYALFDTTATDTFEFWLRTPVNYDRTHPPAILVWWHGYGANSLELRATNFPALCDERGWMAASIRGPFDGKHYQGRRGQHQMDSMLTWAMDTAPFSMDSIYMAGSSMGAAAGLVWHNNHCGIHDFMPAAVVGGSPILDCELRQQQYVDSGHTLDAMRAVFGGFPWDSDSIAHEYHRASAIRISDTLESMHFNALHLPAYNTWGTSDNAWNAEWFAYGRPAQALDSLRRADHADTTKTFCSGINAHGYPVLYQDSVMMWLSGFRANRYPDNISINADEYDEYYWTKASLDTQRFTMGRYGAVKDSAHKRLDINLVRNVAALDVEFLFPWGRFDTLNGHWINRDSVAIPHATIQLTSVPAVREVRRNGATWAFTYANDTLTVVIPGSGDYTVIFQPNAADRPTALQPLEIALSAAYPNPFNSQMVLEIQSNISARREIRLFDVTGRLAKTIMANLNPGTQRIMLSGDGLSSGIYFVSIPGTHQAPAKIVLLK
ncbi:MAG TPA: T9SS type A sorting domain-containing protein [bacterium]|jgi:hypothetical protein